MNTEANALSGNVLKEETTGVKLKSLNAALKMAVRIAEGLVTAKQKPKK